MLLRLLVPVTSACQFLRFPKRKLSSSNVVHLDATASAFWPVVSQCELGRNLNDISDGDDAVAAPLPEGHRHDEGHHRVVVRVFSGMRWECLEYARRYYICHHNVTFPSLSGADCLWSLASFACVRTAAEVPILKFTNGEAHSYPQAGDMLVYPFIFPEADLPHGHVAIVNQVHLFSDSERDTLALYQQAQDERTVPHLSPNDKELREQLMQCETLIGCVSVAEQNWDNCVWTHITYSRRLGLVKRVVPGENQVVYRLCDCRPYRVVGWMRCSPHMSDAT